MPGRADMVRRDFGDNRALCVRGQPADGCACHGSVPGKLGSPGRVALIVLYLGNRVFW